MDVYIPSPGAKLYYQSFGVVYMNSRVDSFSRVVSASWMAGPGNGDQITLYVRTLISCM